MQEDEFLNYLNDSLKNIIHKAVKVHQVDAFSNGLIHGYYETISHLISQAEVFGIKDLLDDYLKNFNPDNLLTGKAKTPFE